MILPTVALSVRQPKAYLAGCLMGDAFWARGGKKHLRNYLGLRVADWDFARAFAESINVAYGLAVSPRADERGYAFVRTYNGYGRFDELCSIDLPCLETKAAWLRGLFDSEGNVVCARKPRGPHSWDRRVAMFSTAIETLSAASEHLRCLGIASRIVKWAHSQGHKGTKQVFCLLIDRGKESYQKFAEAVGSSIERKRRSLELLPTTYHPDLSQRRREMQILGVQARRARRAEREQGA